MKNKNSIEIKPGIYKHFKGNLYQVLSVGTHSETEEAVVTYQKLYDDCRIFVRPLSMWTADRFKPFDLCELDYFFDKVALLAIKDNKVLMARSKGKEHFYMPGGKREKGETDVQCLKRECQEELGIEINENSAFLYGSYTAYSYTDKPPARLIMYQAKYVGKPKPTSEIEEIKWIGYKDREKAIGGGRTLLDELYWKGLIK